MTRFKVALELLALAAALTVGGCESSAGPAEVKLGRDVCEMCGMIISDPRYVTEVRGGPENRVKKFDDMGDAVTWLEKKGWGLAATKEFWAMNSDDGKTWLDARQSFFVHGDTPMNYGFAAVPDHREGSLTFDEMRAVVMARGSTSMCAPDQQTGGAKP